MPLLISEISFSRVEFCLLVKLSQLHLDKLNAGIIVLDMSNTSCLHCSKEVSSVLILVFVLEFSLSSLSTCSNYLFIARNLASNYFCWATALSISAVRLYVAWLWAMCRAHVWQMIKIKSNNRSILIHFQNTHR